MVSVVHHLDIEGALAGATIKITIVSSDDIVAGNRVVWHRVSLLVRLKVRVVKSISRFFIVI